MRIFQATFLWRNDQPDGLGITFGPAAYTPDELTHMFAGEVVNQYFRDTDSVLGTNIVDAYLAQLRMIAIQARRSSIPIHAAVMAALNIMWLADRGFIPNDEFNGVLFVKIP